MLKGEISIYVMMIAMVHDSVFVFPWLSYCSHFFLPRTGMAGVPGTASDIFSAVKDVGANVIMISQVYLFSSFL